jgi:hypothetical protein
LKRGKVKLQEGFITRTLNFRVPLNALAECIFCTIITTLPLAGLIVVITGVPAVLDPNATFANTVELAFTLALVIVSVYVAPAAVVRLSVVMIESALYPVTAPDAEVNDSDTMRIDPKTLGFFEGIEKYILRK